MSPYNFIDVCPKCSYRLILDNNLYNCSNEDCDMSSLTLEVLNYINGTIKKLTKERDEANDNYDFIEKYADKYHKRSKDLERIIIPYRNKVEHLKGINKG